LVRVDIIQMSDHRDIKLWHDPAIFELHYPNLSIFSFLHQIMVPKKSKEHESKQETGKKSKKI